LIFDPTPERGTVTAVWTALFGSSPVWLGPGLVWLVLVSAFGWTWLGYVVSLFRAGLDAIPDDVSRTIAAEGVTVVAQATRSGPRGKVWQHWFNVSHACTPASVLPEPLMWTSVPRKF